MFKKIKNQKGFSLIEVLVSMAIFVTFVGILINSYTSIVAGQREANEYRIMYVEARKVFDNLVNVFREGMVDYNKMNELGADLLRGQQDIRVVSKDGLMKTRVFYEDGKVKITEGRVNNPTEDPVDTLSYDLNTDAVQVSKFSIFVSPSLDPYDPKFVSYDVNQFHPKVTIYAEFEREARGDRVFSFDLQTTISSRIYNQIYQDNDIL